MREKAPISSRAKTLLGYSVMVAVTVALFFLIRRTGNGLVAPPALTGTLLFGTHSAAVGVDALFHVLLALVVVILVARAVGSLFKYLHQPPVVGEILAGILLGPSLLGRVAPSLSAYLLPTTVAPFLGILSQVGVILYMFLVGVELDPALLKKRGHSTIAISHASIIAPFLLGGLLSLFLYTHLSTSDVPFTVFALFMGVSMSVTAFPVLARILTDRKIHTTHMGVIALTCAAVDDVTAWCLLAFVVSIVKARLSGVLFTSALTVGYIACIIFFVRPAMVRLTRLYGQKGRLTQGVMAMVFVALLLSALATDLIGIHAVFGAFALGAAIPHDSGLARELTDRLEDLVVVLLLPAFFAFTGMRTQIGLVRGTEAWLLCGLIIVVASLGKFGGSALAARVTGLKWRDAVALGVLMNTRGLMELIVLNIGLELHVLSPMLFAMLVFMAIITTFATTPILHLITRGQRLQAEPGRPIALRPIAAGTPRRGGVLAPISNPQAVSSIIELAIAVTRPGDPTPRILALVPRPPGGVRSGLREVEAQRRPHSPILLDAVAYARSVGAAIEPSSRWTDDPAADILGEAEDPNIRWVLLGFHRPVFGTDLMGGVVKEVLSRGATLDLDVAVILHGHDRPIDKVMVVVDQTPDGRAALDFAVRVAQRKSCALHAVLVPEHGVEPEPELQEMLKEASRMAGRWLHTDVLDQQNSAALTFKTRGPLVVMGTGLADRIGLPFDEVDQGQRCLVLVQGSAERSVGKEPSRSEPLSAEG